MRFEDHFDGEAQCALKEKADDIIQKRVYLHALARSVLSGCGIIVTDIGWF